VKPKHAIQEAVCACEMTWGKVAERCKQARNIL